MTGGAAAAGGVGLSRLSHPQGACGLQCHGPSITNRGPLSHPMAGFVWPGSSFGLFSTLGSPRGHVCTRVCLSTPDCRAVSTLVQGTSVTLRRVISSGSRAFSLFLAVSLRCHSHVTQFPHTNCTVEWLLLCSQLCNHHF